MDNISDFLKGIICGALLGVAVTIVAFSLSFAATQEKENTDNSWGESAEFTQLETGQDRFSLHNSNIADNPVIVDHYTGIMYMRGIGILVDENGEPLRVLEAGE